MLGLSGTEGGIVERVTRLFILIFLDFLDCGIAQKVLSNEEGSGKGGVGSGSGRGEDLSLVESFLYLMNFVI